MKKMTRLVLIFICMIQLMACSRTNEAEDKITFFSFISPRETRVILEMEKALVEEYTDYTVTLENVDQVSLGWTFLEAGVGDGYMEYTGTAYTTILQNTITEDVLDPEVMKKEVQRQLSEKGYVLLENYGFANTYAVAVTEEFAAMHELETISDLVELAPELTIVANADFLNRDGVLSFSSLCDRYGLEFGNAISMDVGLMYQAMAKGEVHACIAYTTDGALIDQNLKCLEDDMNVFPPYEACTLIRTEVLEKHEGLEAALNRLSGQVTAREMQEMNRAIMADEISDHDMAIKFLRRKGLIGD